MKEGDLNLAKILYSNALPQNIFTNILNLHTYNLRHSDPSCFIPRPRTESGQNNLYYRGSVLSNKIHPEIRQSPNLNAFKISLNEQDFL